MPKKAKELGALAVSHLRQPGLHFVGGVAGLALQVLPRGGRTWILRMTVGSRRRDMGLGGYPDVPVALARDAARAARALVKAGVDPIELGRSNKSRLKAAQAKAMTFEECASKYVQSREAEFSPKHGKQWPATLSKYVYPRIGHLLVQDINLPNVLAVLEPIWHTTTETATRVRGRIEAVLDWAAAHGYRQGPNPARWKGHLDKVLAKPGKIAKVAHHPAPSLAEAPDLFRALHSVRGQGALALRFLFLTAARSGEVRMCRWEEIDFANALWTVPAARMKAGREHRVPLSPAAVGLLKGVEPQASQGLVFRSTRDGPLSDMTLSAVLKRMKLSAVPHGFRSTFADWAGEITDFPQEMVELALAHAVADKVEAAYRRGNMLSKRRKMMDDWASFLSAR